MSIFEPGSSSPDGDGLAWFDDFAFSWAGHAEGFLAVGRYAAQHLEDIPALMGPDGVAFPIIYLHRHALELKLKEVIEHARHILGEATPPPDHEHNLATLWWIARVLVDRCPVGIPDPELDLCQTGVEELARVDPASTGFRYPESRTGGRPVPADLETVDLVHFSNEVSEIFDCLEAWLTGIHEYLQAAHDHRMDSTGE
jgi:hypothetical protein